MIAQFDGMPDIFQLPVRLILPLFHLHAIARFGRRYTMLDLHRRRAITASWRASPIKTIRDLIQLFDALVLFHMASETERHDAAV